MAFQAGSKTESGYLAVPASGSGPGVLVLHAWWGLNDFFIALCDRLAQAGFVALAPDLYDSAIATSVEEAKALVQVHDANADAVQNKVLEALDSLKQFPELVGSAIGTLGCSLGVWWALQVSALRPDDIAAAVLFYGLGETDFAATRAAYLGHYAENDEWEPIDQVPVMEAAIRSAGRDVTFYLYPGVGHWFFEDNQPTAFNTEAAQLAWDRTIAFLRERLKP